MTHPPEPTAEQCNQNAQVEDFEGRRAYACWYPQMGGYGSRAVVLPGDPPDAYDDDPMPPCFEAYVWHDGEFPFSDADAGRTPAHLHHCSAAQFVAFGQWVLGLVPTVV